MGHLFKYIADTIVANTAIADTSCPGCQESVPVFPIEASPEQEEWDDSEGVEELCAKCLRSIPLRKLETRDQEMKIQQWINQHYPKGTLRGDERLSKFVGICDEFRRTASATNFVARHLRRISSHGICDEFRRTPTFPLFLQGEDWPFCCGDFAEFQGTPKTYEESIRIGREWALWDRKFTTYEDLFGDMTLEPESLREVSLFRCPRCEKEIYTWQCT